MYVYGPAATTLQWMFIYRRRWLLLLLLLLCIKTLHHRHTDSDHAECSQVAIRGSMRFKIAPIVNIV